LQISNNNGKPFPVSDVDPFSNDYILNPYNQHERLREAGPIVWLDRLNVWATGRFAEVKAVLGDPETFCSGAGVGLANFHQEKPWRVRSLLLETDPPDHTRNRAIISRALSPASLKALRARFEAVADELIAPLVEGKRFDAVRSLAEPFPLQVFGDAVGIRREGRAHLVEYGNMVFNTLGPRNEHYESAMSNAETVIEWISQSCRREALTPDGLGAQIYAAADEGGISEADAALIVRSFLSAGVDTTTNGIANSLYCFANYPEQWRAVLDNPSFARAAFEEVMRFESPFQTFFRTATRDVEIAGVQIKKEQKLLLSLGSANRDPRQWPEPESFDVQRKTQGHVGFGFGIHGCVGQMIARLEIEALLGAIARRGCRIEIDGEVRQLRHNTLRGFETLPVRLVI
jgi:cytochrome P450